MSLKTALQKLIFPIGSTQKIRLGYLKNMKLVVSQNTQWAPLIGRWEPAMQKIFVNMVKPGNTVYDLGANFGLHGMLCSRLIGAEGMLYNFEPLPNNVAEIDRNYKLNGITNYKTIQKAVSDQNSVLKFTLAKHATQGQLTSSAGSGSNTIDVSTTTLDSFIADGNRLPDFIKMDIEGAEGEGLAGFANSIEKCFPFMIIELHSPEADKKVGEFLKFHKYKAYRFDTFSGLRFEEVKNLSLPYPHPEGIWGSILCVAPTRSLDQYTFNK